MAPTDPSSLSCPASDGTTYTTPSGSLFNIHCATDYYGGDMGLTQTATFADCLTTCASTPNCVDVAYVSPNCYLKSSVTTASTNANVWGAVLASAEAAAANRITCDANKSDGRVYTAPSGAEFVIECGIDHFGGDMGNLYAETMEACLDACDGMNGCIDVAYAGKYCYLKNSLEAGQANSGVWGATKRESAVASASGAASSAAVSTTTDAGVPAASTADDSAMATQTE